MLFKIIILIKRTSKNHIEKILSENPDWKILDIGCGYGANKYATTISDIMDLSDHYKDKSFIKITEKKLPFKDKEFDFVIASHVAEHVEDISYFLNELSRVGKKGYIEVPTRLEDNLVFENKKAHIWHLVFDDVNNQINISKKQQYLEPVLTVGTIKKLNEYFRESLVIELSWENSIKFNMDEYNLKTPVKISILNLLKKYFSKKIRLLIK
ncbi:class I SAM-dependent methyltransferase [Pelagibacterales bacterium SAG-MED17]|nr:class I SAM-dependent methyltransferase [Pelagibacterales bacterium SAG-MED17]